MAMFCIFTQAGIGDDYQFGISVFDQAAGLLYRFFCIPGATADSIFIRGDTKQYNGRNSKFADFL